MIENINQKMRHTSNTLPIEGMAPTNAFTTTFIPSNLDNARRGRRARNVRKERIDAIWPFPVNSAVKETSET